MCQESITIKEKKICSYFKKIWLHRLSEKPLKYWQYWPALYMGNLADIISEVFYKQQPLLNHDILFTFSIGCIWLGSFNTYNLIMYILFSLSHHCTIWKHVHFKSLKLFDLNKNHNYYHIILVSYKTDQKWIQKYQSRWKFSVTFWTSAKIKWMSARKLFFRGVSDGVHSIYNIISQR